MSCESVIGDEEASLLVISRLVSEMSISASVLVSLLVIFGVFLSSFPMTSFF